MLQGFWGGHSLIDIFNNKLINEVFGIVTNLLPIIWVILIITVFDLSEYFLVIVSEERGIATEKSVGDNSDRPVVTSVVIVSFKNFRGHIVWSPYFWF